MNVRVAARKRRSLCLPLSCNHLFTVTRSFFEFHRKHLRWSKGTFQTGLKDWLTNDLHDLTHDIWPVVANAPCTEETRDENQTAEPKTHFMVNSKNTKGGLELGMGIGKIYWYQNPHRFRLLIGFFNISFINSLSSFMGFLCQQYFIESVCIHINMKLVTRPGYLWM